MEPNKKQEMVITKKLIEKMIEWVSADESKFIKADPNFWLGTRYYLFLSLNVSGWIYPINTSSNKQIRLELSDENQEIIDWFVRRYEKKKK